MKLEWVGASRISSPDKEKYPHGYWYATTDDDGYDADGATPLEAVSNLAEVLEEAVGRGESGDER